MMSNIKDKKRKNDDDELSEHFQNAEIVIRQESNIIFEKTIQFKTKNNNKKVFSHEFSENDVIDYITFVEKKRARNKNLKVKRKYQILLKKNKRLQIFFQNDKVNVSIRCKRSVARASNNFFNKIFQLKCQRSIVELKSTNLNLYYNKNYKEFKN